MGFIRGGLLVIVCVLFFVGLLVSNSIITIHGSLAYNNIKENLGNSIRIFAGNELNSSQLINAKDLKMMEGYCKNHDYYTTNANFSDMNININISCASALQGQDAIVNEFVNETIDQIYYKNYDCKFSTCLEDKNKAFYFASQQFRDYLSSKVYFLIIFLIIMFILIFLLAENKSNAFIISGILLIVAALPFMKIESFFSSLLGGNSYGLAKVFLSDAYKVFIVNLIIGIILLAIGIILKFFNIGMKISEFFSKKKEVSEEKVDEIVKQEIKKAKTEETKKQSQSQGIQNQAKNINTNKSKKK